MRDLPQTICMRVTRACNASCFFCLAPPDSLKVPVGKIKKRIDKLASMGVNTIHLCGGEPTIYPNLPEVLHHIRNINLESKITTNGKKIEKSLLKLIAHLTNEIKISVHGDSLNHNKIVGKGSFESALFNIKKLVLLNSRITIQTVALKDRLENTSHVISLCEEQGVNKLTILPFIPRGNGKNHSTNASLSSNDWLELDAIVQKARKRNIINNLNILNLANRKTFVVETDGTIWKQAGHEGEDEYFGKLEEQ